MTHSLHRRGNIESLSSDYVILITPAIGINTDGARGKLVTILKRIKGLEPVNIGSYETGNAITGATFSGMAAAMKDSSRVRCVFSDRKKVLELVKWLVCKEFGLSVAISGLVKEIEWMCRELNNLQPHSVHFSLGLWGAKDKLPSNDVLELVTMCGHGLISSILVGHVIKEVRTGEISCREGAEKIGIPCVCGIFNLERATQLLAKQVEKRAQGDTRLLE